MIVLVVNKRVAVDTHIKIPGQTYKASAQCAVTLKNNSPVFSNETTDYFTLSKRFQTNYSMFTQITKH